MHSIYRSAHYQQGNFCNGYRTTYTTRYPQYYTSSGHYYRPAQQYSPRAEPYFAARYFTTVPLKPNVAPRYYYVQPEHQQRRYYAYYQQQPQPAQAPQQQPKSSPSIDLTTVVAAWYQAQQRPLNSAIQSAWKQIAQEKNAVVFAYAAARLFKAIHLEAQSGDQAAQDRIQALNSQLDLIRINALVRQHVFKRSAQEYAKAHA